MTLRLTKLFKIPAQPSLQNQTREPQEVRLLEKLFEVAAEDQTLSKFEVINAELIGYCNDADQQVYTKMFGEFAAKFSPFIELKPLTLSSVCDN